SSSASGGAAIELYNYTGTLNVRNCTITGNTASAGNGGGIGAGLPSTAAVLNVVSSVVAGNTGSTSPDLYDSTTAFNVSNSAIGSTFTQGTVSANLTTAQSTPANLFGTNVLANNGGPTNTLALAAGSPALDT